MALTLGIDTSHHVAVGLARDGVPLDRLVVADTRSHGEALAPAVAELCARHGYTLRDIEEFAVGMGPGPFTGLRVGIVAARTYAHLAGRTAHGVCSLDVVARQWDGAPEEYVVASDARRKELYWARYAAGARVGEPQVGAPGTLPDLPVAGAVPEEYRAQLRWAPDGPQALDPAVLAAFWRELPAADGEPYYLRPADATVGGPAKSTLPTPRTRLRARR